MHRGYTTPLVIAIMAFAIVAFLFLIDTAIMPANSNQVTNRTVNKNADDVACTMEAKLCPDGSTVGRSGPTCEFAECPTTTNTNSSTNTNSITSAFFQINEWEVELPTSTGITYVYSLNTSTSSASFSTTEIQSEDFCSAAEGAIGIISRYRAPVTDGPLSTQTPIKLQDWYYYYTSPQSTCSDDARITTLETQGVTALRESFRSLRTTVSSGPTAGWKTYTNTAGGYGFKYPSNFVVESYDNSYSAEIKDGDTIVGQVKYRLDAADGSLTYWYDTTPMEDARLGNTLGKKFIYRYCDGPSCGTDTVAYVVQHREKLLGLEFPGDKVMNDTETQILSTFIFTD